VWYLVTTALADKQPSSFRRTEEAEKSLETVQKWSGRWREKQEVNHKSKGRLKNGGGGGVASLKHDEESQ
jgi:hypothetical protein